MIAVLSTKMHELKSGLGMLHVLTTFLTLNKKVLMPYGHFFIRTVLDLYFHKRLSKVAVFELQGFYRKI